MLSPLPSPLSPKPGKFSETSVAGRRRPSPASPPANFLVSLLFCYSFRPLTAGRPWSGFVFVSGGRTLLRSSPSPRRCLGGSTAGLWSLRLPYPSTARCRLASKLSCIVRLCMQPPDSSSDTQFPVADRGSVNSKHSGNQVKFSFKIFFKSSHHLAFLELSPICPGLERRRSVAGFCPATLSGCNPGTLHGCFPFVSPLFCCRMRTMCPDAAQDLGQSTEKFRITKLSFAVAATSERHLQAIIKHSLSDLLTAAGCSDQDVAPPPS